MPDDPCLPPVLDPNCPFLANVPDFETYVTPFPSNDGSPKIADLVEAIGDTEGTYASWQASSWARVVSMGMKVIATSPVVGGLRSDLMPKLVGTEDTVGGQIVTGIFANVSFPASTSKKAMVDAAVNTGFAIAATAVNAVPVVGQILSAAIAIGAFFYNLFRRKGDNNKPELVVPWQEWSAASDEDLVRVLRGPLQSVDWSILWAPPFDIGPGFQILKTKKGGDTRGYGAFGQDGTAHYSAFGAMPGTQRMAEIVQIAPIYKGTSDRIDAVTNIADFYPSTAQFATFAWQMVMRMGGVWMFNVRPGDLEAQWAAYWDAYFGEGLEQLAKLKGGSVDSLFLAKAIGKFLTFKDVNWHIGLPDQYIERSGNLDAFIDDRILSTGNRLHPGTRYYTPQRLIAAQLDTLRERQLAALSKTIVSAYVRPDPVNGMPAHAAFLDTSPATDPAFATWGEQLAARCREVREILLTHEARCLVRRADAELADPAFAARLGETIGKTCVTKLKSESVNLGKQSRTSRPSPPQGGAPFEPTGGGRRRTSTAVKVAGGVAAFAAAGYAGRRLHWW